MNKRKTSLIFFIFSMIFLYLPLIVLIIYSFNSSKSVVWEGFSLKWYKELFDHSGNLWNSFKYSIFIAIYFVV